MTATVELADFVSSLAFDDLPSDAVANAKLAIIDTVGVAIFGSTMSWSTMVADVGRALESGGRSTILARNWSAGAPIAALVNGTAAHAVEMDDRRQVLELHNGATTVPAALAVAEDRQRDGRDLIVAVTAGYEVAFRLTRAAHARSPNFYPSTWTTIGAAAAAGRLLDLDAGRQANAFGLAGSMSSGINAFLDDPLGTMVKRIQGGGWPAQSGVMAALLAERGLTGPRTVLEGDRGVLRSFCTAGEPDFGALTRDLGSSFEIAQFQTKAYAAWGGSHCTLEGVYDLLSRWSIAAGDIRRIRLGISSKIEKKARRQPVESPLAAQHNLPFLVAAALFYDLRDPASWHDEIVSERRIQEAMGLVEVALDPEIEAIYRSAGDDEGGAKVAFDLADGRSVETWIRHAKGNPGNLMTGDDVAAKFRLLAGHVLPSDRVDGLLAYLQTLDELRGPVSVRDVAAPGQPVP